MGSSCGHFDKHGSALDVASSDRLEAEQEPSVTHEETAKAALAKRAMPGERFPETRLRRIDSDFAKQLADTELQYAINEMFARHGAVFGRKELDEVFRGKEWYQPVTDLSFDDAENSRFSDIKRANLKVLGKERDTRKGRY